MFTFSKYEGPFMSTGKKASEVFPTQVGCREDYGTYVAILGYKCKDLVTGFTGVASSVSFDLYGCVQVVLSSPVDKDGNTHQSWFDFHRLKVIGKAPVMKQPTFIRYEEKGPAEKPMF